MQDLLLFFIMNYKMAFAANAFPLFEPLEILVLSLQQENRGKNFAFFGENKCPLKSSVKRVCNKG